MKYINTYIEKVEKIPSLFFIAILSWFVGSGHYSKWFYLHSNMFIVLIGVLVSAILQVKKKNLLFLSSLCLAVILSEFEFIQFFSRWIFFQSPIRDWFNNLNVKDSNVASMLIIVVLSFLLLMIETIGWCRKKFNLINIFILITSGAIILTTIIFHYYIINQNLNREKQQIFSHMSSLSKIRPPLLQILCKAQDYQCYVNPSQEEFSAQEPQLLQIYRDYQRISPEVVSISNFTFDDKMIIAFRLRQVWILDFKHYHEAFSNAEGLFLSLCVWAHGFWLVFMSFLISFHMRKKIKKPQLI